MPGDEDYINLDKLIIPLDLNYCQCMLELEEYYEVIEHATELIEKHKGKSVNTALQFALHYNYYKY